MKSKEFVLPELWCIKVNEYNKDELKKWVYSRTGIHAEYLSKDIQHWVISDRYDGSYQKWIGHIPHKHTEITFEQFKKYVIGKNMKITELLELLDKEYGGNSPHKLILFGDYSGAIEDNCSEELMQFSDYDDMQEELNKLYKDIKEEDIKFEL